MSVESDEPSPATTPGSYDVQPEAPHLSTFDVWHEVVDDATTWAHFKQGVFLPNKVEDTVKLDVDLGRPIGTKDETGIRIIVTGDGRVINNFPINMGWSR